MAATLDSVLKQTYRNYEIEIIVVNDGSPDSALLDPYRDSIKYIIQENRGSSAAGNTALKVARRFIPAVSVLEDSAARAEAATARIVRRPLNANQAAKALRDTPRAFARC